MTANKARCEDMVESSIGNITAVAPHIGYANASLIAQKALIEQRKLRDVILESGLLSEKDLNIILKPKSLTRPGIAGKQLLQARLKDQNHESD